MDETVPVMDDLGYTFFWCILFALVIGRLGTMFLKQSVKWPHGTPPLWMRAGQWFRLWTIKEDWDMAGFFRYYVKKNF